MSQENVEVVRRGLEAWQRDDLEAFLSVIDPDVEWHPGLEGRVEGMGGVYRGIEGAREFWTVRRSEFQAFGLEFQEPRDLGDDRVLTLGHLRWRGAASGLEIESPFALVATVRAGKVVRSIGYLSHREALEAVGLPE